MKPPASLPTKAGHHSIGLSGMDRCNSPLQIDQRLGPCEPWLLRPARKRQLLQGLFQDRRKGKHGNAFVQQLHGFLQRGLPANGTLIGITRMDFASLFSEARAHIFRLCHHAPDLLQPGSELLRGVCWGFRRGR